MKKHLETFIMLSKFSFHVFIIQCIFSSTLFAWEGNAQVKSVREVEITLKAKNESLNKILREIELKTEFIFVYSKEDIRNKSSISIDISNQTVADALVEISRQANVKFKQVNNNIGIQLLEDRKNGQPVEVQLIQIGISGKVTDENGEALPGATVQELGTSNGTITDVEGNFTLDVTSSDAVLVVSFVGYEKQEIPVNGRTTLDISLGLDVSSLEEVVVTAFGIEKDKKALSYAVQEVDGEAVAKVGNSNVISSLQGKVAGVIVRPSTGAPGARPQITIRGSRSFVGDNEPLYVVDGLPISGGDRALDINPNDVESINVLKGPSAAALYGLRASNGVIVITTKRGKGVKGKPQISFESNYNFDQISVMPDIQQTYMQGEAGVFNPFSAFSWGPRIDTMGLYTNQLGEEEQAMAYNNAKDFFNTGRTYNANFTIANSFEDGNYAVGLGYTNQEGIVPGTDMGRINFKFANDYNIGERVKLSSSLNYSNVSIHEAVEGSGNSSLFYGAFFAPVSYDLANKPISEPGEPFNQINFRGQHDNIYWSLKNNYTDSKVNRFFGNINLRYNIIKGLDLNYRLGIDTYTDSRKTVLALGSGNTSGRTNPPSGGSISDRINTNQQINSNINLQYSKLINESFSIDLLVGNEIFDSRNRILSNQGNDIVIGGFDHVSNTTTQTTDEYNGQWRVVGFYANLSASWKNTLFLNATGRNDVVSNMPNGNRSFFYPSLGLGMVFSEFLNNTEKYFTYGKIRASVAEVGQAGPIFSTQNVFVQGDGGGFTFPYNGINAFTLSNNLNSQILQPENTRTLELGIDLKFFDARLGIDYTYFSTNSFGQIYRVPIARSTGFATELRNAGEMSVKGHELILTGRPVFNEVFQWEVSTNFTSYNNVVVSLAEGIERLELGGFRVNIVAEEGMEYPSLRAVGYARDPATNQVVVDSRATLPNGNPNPRYGMPLRATEEVALGSVQPDFEIGFTNTLNFHAFSLMAQLDWRKGGLISSGINRLGRLYGVLADTENRDADYVFPGKKGYFDGTGNLVVEADNDVVIQQGYEFYRRNQDPISESIVFDASFVKLREISLTYNLPDKILGDSFISSASVFITGRNILLWANLPNFDPETGSGNGGGNAQGEEYVSYPQLRSYGVGLRLKM